MSSKAAPDSFVFDLDGDGQGGFYRVRMANKPGEINRPVMINRGDKFQVLADLLDVAHGTASEGGESATLVVASFYFLPSHERRFKRAQITWTFTSDDPAVDVEVTKIAPMGTWSLTPTKRTDERSVTGKGEVGASAGPATAGGGGEYSMKQTQDRDFHTEVTGAKRVNERETGGHDTARWDLEENPAQSTGIARMLQVGLLLKRTVLPGMTPKPGPPPTFRGTLEVVAEKDWWSQRASEVKRVWKKTDKEDAIVFRPGVDRTSGLFDIQQNNLDSLHLQDKVMFMSLHESYEEVQKERKARTCLKDE
ncbi:hypothetical protein BKA67DRAFT_658109 [Truncatella angustata]|uniref:Uncharacterized protein n=1 Tax=Truncatella angustata TaxID=152316 RepID=A0A9P8UKQ7_9PEZI|nr:uncharacterized protein BKA67DRAFT_658109 [Truncatella angustata]KAH6653767.1 hypothetical protein BKA67DRAFT_658109 [Truncatella angustata]KAH8199095.1 hypothetical protein TruAng_006731 [Truncatella angustata]